MTRWGPPLEWDLQWVNEVLGSGLRDGPISARMVPVPRPKKECDQGRPDSWCPVCNSMHV